jgi:hypothetical protein
VLLDGDKMAALFAVYLRQLLKHAGPAAQDVQMGVVQTAYANGASTRFLTDTLGLTVCCTNTGGMRVRRGRMQASVSVARAACRALNCGPALCDRAALRVCRRACRREVPAPCGQGL